MGREDYPSPPTPTPHPASGCCLSVCPAPTQASSLCPEQLSDCCSQSPRSFLLKETRPTKADHTVGQLMFLSFLKLN